MATTPRTPTAPANPTPTHPSASPPTSTSHAEEQKPAAPLIVDEQRQRSAEIERMGTAEWVRQHDERPKEDQPILHKGTIAGGDTLDSPPSQKQVAGVSSPMKDDGKGTLTQGG